MTEALRSLFSPITLVFLAGLCAGQFRVRPLLSAQIVGMIANVLLLGIGFGGGRGLTEASVSAVLPALSRGI